MWRLDEPFGHLKQTGYPEDKEMALEGSGIADLINRKSLVSGAQLSSWTAMILAECFCVTREV